MLALLQLLRAVDITPEPRELEILDGAFRCVRAL